MRASVFPPGPVLTFPSGFFLVEGQRPREELFLVLVHNLGKNSCSFMFSGFFKEFPKGSLLKVGERFPPSSVVNLGPWEGGGKIRREPFFEVPFKGFFPLKGTQFFGPKFLVADFPKGGPLKV